ncbi:hypothetical protein TH9_06740 [Thalassospira xiamenensis]|uniref:lipopolysaccharide biosynthesis protein n=1 Tax=Thalassospira xiamenensis TaxID=220697 RepID=UPI000DED9956|nr:hypothetical protein [Thalassospira xiamenensis]RCK34079.1 hypothetical protein TH9_06740 [Thalassospira xiamenensis]
MIENASLLTLAARLRNCTVMKRLARGVAANFLGKIWVLLVQLMAIPVLTAYWGADGYGIWLVLITIPTYLNLSDIGLGTAAGVEMTKQIANDDQQGACATFHSAWLFITGLTVACSLLAIGYSAFIVANAPPDANRFEGTSLAFAILSMTLYAAVSVQMRLLQGLYQATHKYALGIFLNGLIVPAEGIAMVLVAASGGAILELSLTMLFLRLLAWCIFYSILRRHEPWFYIGWRKANWGRFKVLFKPSLAAFVLIVADAMILQSVIIILGWVAGVGMVAIFGAARFLSRVPLQLSSLLSRASLPELTRALSAENFALASHLSNLNVITALAITLPFTVILALFGSNLLSLISYDHLNAGQMLFTGLALAATLNAVWSALATPLISMNRQGLFSWHYLTAATFLLVAIFVSPWDKNLSAAWSMALVEAGMVGVVSWRVKTTRSFNVNH